MRNNGKANTRGDLQNQDSYGRSQITLQISCELLLYKYKSTERYCAGIHFEVFKQLVILQMLIEINYWGIVWWFFFMKLHKDEGLWVEFRLHITIFLGTSIQICIRVDNFNAYVCLCRLAYISVSQPII